ncbi:hypothetical protein HY837_06955 [archaeon]|nr:hypothetical protein [archaeon]
MELSQIFKDSVRSNKVFFEALDIVRLNSRGNVWLIGGFLYRTLASHLYSISKPEVDFDFLIEKPMRIVLPTDWEGKLNRYGNPKLVKGSCQIDYVPFEKVHDFLGRKTEKIEDYLSGVPLSIQSIAYDVSTQKVIGDVGIDSLLSKTVKVNDRENARIYAQKKEKDLNYLIKEKAKSLGFKAILV